MNEDWIWLVITKSNRFAMQKGVLMISEITKEQWAKVAEYREECLRIGYSTEPLDRAKAEAAVRDIADFLKIKITGIRFLDSPFAVAKGRQKSEYKNFWSWAGYYTQYSFILNEIFPEKKAEFPLLARIMEWKAQLHHITYADGFFYLSERPVTLKVNASGLHRTDGKALEYKDGYGVYSLNGVRVPEYVVMTKPDDFDFKKVMKEQNVEIRREILRKAGVARLIKGLGAKVVDEKMGYQVLRIDLGDNNINYALRMHNPSIDVEHVEWVAPDCDTVEKALAFRNQDILKVTNNYFQQGDVLLGVLGGKGLTEKETGKWTKPKLLT